MLKNAFFLFIFAFVLLLIFLPSYTQMQDLRQRNLDYAKQVKELKEEQKRLLEEKRKLEEDPVYLEKVGRERMGLVKEGEVVVEIVPMGVNKTK